MVGGPKSRNAHCLESKKNLSSASLGMQQMPQTGVGLEMLENPSLGDLAIEMC